MKRAQRLLRVAFGTAAGEERGTVLGRTYRVQNRGPAAGMGRFGGGWDFNVGVQMGRRGVKGTIIVNLGKASIRVYPVGEGRP